MKLLGEMMRRDPNDEEREAMTAVVEIALAWKRSELSLSSVRTLCTGRDRYQAMRFSTLKSKEKRALMDMVDALVEQDDRAKITKHGLMDMEELRQDGVKQATTWKGERAWVWPMCWMYGEPYYPRYDLSPGEERREKEEAIRMEYKEYRKTHGKGGGQYERGGER